MTSLASLPQTPSQQRALSLPEDSKLEDHSEDDSDINYNEERATGTPDIKRHQKEAHADEGNYTEELNTNYSLYSNPPNLATIRQQLFDVKDEIEMSAKDFEDYFPFVDNVWRKNKTTDMAMDDAGTSEIYCCRLKPSGQIKTVTPKPQIEGKQQRKKRKREDKTCAMLMKVTYIESPIKKVKITKVMSPESTHTHDLEYMDANKRNSAIMDVARREATRGFLPGSIFWKMQEEPDKMEEAGGKHMKVSDVRNVQYSWRQHHMSMQLKAHTGYTQQRSGPRNRVAKGSTPSTPKNGEVKPHVPAQTYAPHPPQPPPQVQPLQPGAPQYLPPNSLHYPDLAKDFLVPYLPFIPRIASQQRPHITLTWASSLDSRIALQPGTQTAVSGLETKAMTHYLRSQHDAILIGVNTAISDDPGLNCRLAGAGGYGGPPRAMQPRPIIIDPRGRLVVNPNMRLLRAASEGKALGPWIVVGPGVKLIPNAITTLKAHGGEFLQIQEIHPEHGLDWEALFSILHREGIKSIMIEGGGKVLSELLRARYTHNIDSVVITIAPTFFGKQGVQVSPETTYEDRQPIQTRLTDVKWQPMGASDVVMCAHMDNARPAPHQPPPPPPTTQQPHPRLPGIQEFSRQIDSAPRSGPLPAAQNHAYQPPPPPTQPLPAGQQTPRGQPPQLQTNGNNTPAPPNASPQYHHYGHPGPSRQSQ